MHCTTSERTHQTRKLWSKHRALFNVCLMFLTQLLRIFTGQFSVSSPVFRLSYVSFHAELRHTKPDNGECACALCICNVVHKNTNNRCKLFAFAGYCLLLRSFFPRFSPCQHVHSTRALYFNFPMYYMGAIGTMYHGVDADRMWHSPYVAKMAIACSVLFAQGTQSHIVEWSNC